MFRRRKGLHIFKQIPSVFKDAPPTLTRVSPEDAHAVLESLSAYRETLLPERRHFLDQYRAIDVGFKVVGTGSVGLRDYVVYLEGNGPRDPLFLQVKEEAHSGWAPYVEQMPGFGHEAGHQGQRVAEGQRAMQFQSDPFLGWTTIENRPYLVRQLNDHKASIEVDDLRGPGLTAYASICGELLARGHARAGDPAILEGYIGKGGSLGEALAQFAIRYADQTDRDWKTLVRSGLGKPASATPKKAPKAATGELLSIAASGQGKKKEEVSREKPGPERLSAFSDGVIAIIITIMVLELKVPHQASLGAVLALWPVLTSYALSYLIVALIWINHHHLVLHVRHADSLILWTNLLLLFLVSLIPFFTEYMAETRMASFSTALYAASFVAVDASFMLFEHRVALQIDPEDTHTQDARRRAKRRNWIALWLYIVAVPAAYLHPAVSLGIILFNALLYVAPEAYKLVT